MSRSVLDLMPDEQVLWQGMRSWQSMIFSFYLKGGSVASVPLIGSMLLESLTDTDMPMGKVVFFTVIAYIFIGVIGAIKRHYTVYTVTDRRLNIRTGFLGYRHHGGALDRIQSVKYEQTIMGRLLNYGNILIDTAATGADDSDYDLIGVISPSKRRNQIDSLSHDASQQSPRDGH